VERTEGDLGKDAAGPLRTQAQALLAATEQAAQEAARTRQEVDRFFNAEPARMDTAFKYLNPGPRGTKSDRSWGLPVLEAPPDRDPTLEKVLAGIRDHKPDADLAKLALAVDEARLSQAIADAEARIKSFDDATGPVNDTVADLQRWTAQVVALAHAFTRPAGQVQATLSGSVSADDPRLAGLRQAARQVARRADALGAAADRLGSDYAAAEWSYTARRYNREADYNREAASLYEVQKYRSSARSDRHVVRSRLFLIGMLFAQAGVTIATLALAVRQKSVLWGLATVAGLVAVAFGGYLLLGAV
jgi:hypothetical protein